MLQLLFPFLEISVLPCFIIYHIYIIRYDIICIVSNRPSTYRTRSVTERLKQQDDYTNEHPYDTAPNRSSAFHITEDSPPNTSQNRTRSTTKQSNHCLENQKGGYYLRYTKTGKRSCRIITDSSQDD